MKIETPADLHRVLSCRSVKNKIAVAVECDIAPVGDLNIISRLVREGYLTFMERARLWNVIRRDTGRPVVGDVYQLTDKGIALCDELGIKPH